MATAGGWWARMRQDNLLRRRKQCLNDARHLLHDFECKKEYYEHSVRMLLERIARLEHQIADQEQCADQQRRAGGYTPEAVPGRTMVPPLAEAAAMRVSGGLR